MNDVQDQPMFRDVEESDDKVFPLVWYAVGWAKDLKAKPVKRRLLGKDLVLYRSGNGEAKAIHAYCPHRGADLSLGSCSAGQLVCAYHAWRFDEDGSCMAIPAHPGKAIPDFAHSFTYPVVEKAGLLWVYPQPQHRGRPGVPVPELQLYPELEDPSFKLARYDSVWKAHLTRVIESVIDVAHVPIVHRRTIGKKAAEEITISFEAEGDRIRIRNGGGMLDYRFPQRWILTPARESRSKFINFVTFTPIDRETTAIFGLAGRNFATFVPGLTALFSRYSAKVLEEDQAIVESQHPRPIPEALRMEAHVGADGPQVRFRQRWYQFLVSDEPRVYLP